MSFTMWYTRPDGTERPIRMSIFDALRGVPDPKPRKPKATHTQQDQFNHAQGKGKNNAEGKSAGKDDKADVVLTDDDRIMLRMKGENQGCPWKDIAESTSCKDIGTLKSRFNEIKHLASELKKDEAGEGNKKSGKDGDKDARDKKSQAEGKKKQTEAQGKKGENANKKGDDSSGGTTKSNAKDKPANASRSAVDSIKEWAGNYDERKWQAIASKHYDKTGERITPEQARALAES